MQAFRALRFAPVSRSPAFTRLVSSSSVLRSAHANDAVAAAAAANTDRADYLLKFKHPYQMRELHHYTQYVLLAGIPAALVLGQPVSTIFDVAAAFALPLHFHIGMRSVIVDYVDDVPSQRIALAVLAAVTVLTAAGIVKLSLTDVGLTQAIREVWLHQD